MSTYLFLRVYALSVALLLSICFHWSVAVWTLSRVEVCFFILEPFNNCIRVKLVFHSMTLLVAIFEVEGVTCLLVSG